jgi:hypothetical protein
MAMPPGPAGKVTISAGCARVVIHREHHLAVLCARQQARRIGAQASTTGLAVR